LDPELVHTINKNFYVDDCLKSVSTEAEAIKLISELTDTLFKAGFHLTKWVSNSEEVRQNIPHNELAQSMQNYEMDASVQERAIGVQWNVTTDKFGFQVKLKEKPQTRRGILSVVSSLFDPCGFVAPATLPAKMILQTLSKMKLGWDEEISEEEVM
jgi:hypothetical protein